MGAKIQAFDIFQTPLSSHYPLPLKSHSYSWKCTFISEYSSSFLRIRRICRNYVRAYGGCPGGLYVYSDNMGAYGDMANLGLCAIHKIVREFAEINKTYSENTRKESLRTRIRHKEPPAVFTYYVRRHKTEHIPNNNCRTWNILKILISYTRWVWLSLKTISC
jgi:hypothetical protein